MVIKNRATVGKPKLGYEWGWYKVHMKQLRYAIENNACPACQHELVSDDILYDLGFSIGLECIYCR